MLPKEIEEWFASLSPEDRGKLHAMCSVCALPKPASKIHLRRFDLQPFPDATGGEVWRDVAPPMVALLCDECARLNPQSHAEVGTLASILRTPEASAAFERKIADARRLKLV